MQGPPPLRYAKPRLLGKGEEMSRRATVLIAIMGAAMLLASGVALAENVTCDDTAPCHGTPEGDTITGTASGETIYAYGGADSVFPAGATTPSTATLATT
jgi:hypothetical protein